MHAQDHIKHANDLIQGDQQNNVSEVGEVLDIRQIETCSSQEDCLQKLFSCTMTLLAPMLRLQLYRQFETSSSWSCCIHLTVLTSHLATSMPSVHLEKHYMVTGLAVMMK